MTDTIIVIKNIPTKYTYFLKFNNIDKTISANQKPKFANTIFNELKLLYKIFPKNIAEIINITHSIIVKCKMFINIIN